MTTYAVPVRALRGRAAESEDLSDAGLIRAMAAGEAEALRTLYERLGPRVLSYLLGQLPTRELAEEVLQDVFLAAWRASGGFRGDSKVLTWLLTIAHNRAINARRRKQLDKVPLDSRRHGDVRAPDLGERVAHRMDVRHALRTLPEAQRAALELVFFHGLAIAEAAAVLDVAPGTIKSRIFRAKAALRDHLGDKGSDHG